MPRPRLEPTTLASLLTILLFPPLVFSPPFLFSIGITSFVEEEEEEKEKLGREHIEGEERERETRLLIFHRSSVVAIFLKGEVVHFLEFSSCFDE